MTDGKGIPIAIGDILNGNHNDLYQIIPQFAKMTKQLTGNGICIDNSILIQIKALIASVLEELYKVEECLQIL